MRSREKEIYITTLVGGAVNVILLVFKFIAGILSGSAAMIADAVHSFSDFITDVIVIVFVKISSKPQDKSHDYGHGKYETLASTIIGLALLAVALGIIYSGGEKIILWIKGETLTRPGWIALWAALVSIILKELVYQYTAATAKKVNSMALNANAWHHRSDALSSIGTAIGIGGAILLGEKWTVLDPIASIIVGCFIVKVALGMLKNGVDDLMEKSLPDEVEDEIMEIVARFDDVSEPHHLRTRKIGSNYAVEFHIRMDGNITLQKAHDRTTEIEKMIKDRFGEKTHVAIHTEPVKTKCSEQA